MSSSCYRLNFQFNWKFKSKPIIDRTSNDQKIKLIESKIFATNHNNITYYWYIEIAEKSIDETNLIRASLCYRKGPKKNVDCIGTFRIKSDDDDGYIREETNDQSDNTCQININGDVTYCRFQTELDRQYRYAIEQQIIEIDVNLSLAENLFDSIVCIRPIKLVSNAIEINEKMLKLALSGEKNVDNVCIKLVCNNGQFFIHPNIFVNTSDYFKSILSFDKIAKNDEKQIDLSNISKERMIILITYIYTRRIELPDDIESIKELLNESTMMLLDDMKMACERKLGEILIKSNAENIALAADLLIFADKYLLNGLKSIALSIVAKNIEDITDSDNVIEKQLCAQLKADKIGSSSCKSLMDELFEHAAQCRRCPLIR